MNVIETIFAVFTAIIGWFVESITAITGIFWSAETGLTFLGSLALCGLGIAIILMLVALVRSYLRFK